MSGKHYLRSWCKGQSVIAMSFAEAELYAIVKATSETLGMLSMLIERTSLVRGEGMVSPGKISHHPVKILFN